MDLIQVLTGLLRRADHEEAASRLPLGVLPLGKTNCATSAIWGFRGNPEPRHLAEAAMAVIRDIKRPLDVMEITPLQVYVLYLFISQVFNVYRYSVSFIYL